MTPVQTELTALNVAFDAAFNNRQAQAIGALYADDAVVMPAPAGTPVQGATAIAAFFQGLIDAGVIEHRLTMTSSVADCNLAYQHGQWAAAMIGEDGIKQMFGGNVQLVYRKQANGEWKAVTHLWN